MNKKIKKLSIILVSLVLMTGCSIKPEENFPTPSISPEISVAPTPAPTTTPTPTPTPTPIEDEQVPVGKLEYSGNPEMNPMFYPVGSVTYVNLFDEGNSITWGFEGGGNCLTYHGELTELDENIYSVSGDFVVADFEEFECYYDGSYDSLVSEGIDAYIVLKGKRLYAIFEEMSLDELRNYESEYYYRIINVE